MVERYGQERFLIESGAAIRHRDDAGVLYERPLGDDEPIVMVQVKNSTPEPDGSFKDYFIRVPPSMATARQAVAWTFGLLEDQYRPAQES